MNFFRKFAEIFASQAAPPPLVSMTPVANLPLVLLTPKANTAAGTATGTANVVDTGGKFASDVKNTGGKFAASVNDTVGKLLLVSTTAASLPPVSTTPVANNWNNIKLLTPKSELKEKLYLCVNSITQKYANKIMKIFLIENFFLFATGVNDTP